MAPGMGTGMSGTLQGVGNRFSIPGRKEGMGAYLNQKQQPDRQESPVKNKI